jgi:hypothetical protein
LLSLLGGKKSIHDEAMAAKKKKTKVRIRALDEVVLRIMSPSTSETTLTLRGSGGRGVLGVKFLTADDDRMQGCSFSTVSVNSTVEKYVALYNAGTVSVRIRAESDNSLFTVGVASTVSLRF